MSIRSQYGPLILSALFVLLNSLETRGQSFSFQRQPGGGVMATARADVLLLTGGGTVTDDPPDQMGDVLVAQAATASDSETDPDMDGLAQAASEAQINIATNASGFGPTTNVVGSYQVTVTSDTTPVSLSRATSTANTSAGFIVASDDVNSGLFEGGLMIAAPGDLTESTISFAISATINVGTSSFSLSAMSNGMNEFDVTVTTPSGTINSTTSSLNQFLFISSPVSPGDAVSMQTMIGGFLEVSAGTPDDSTDMGQLFPVASAFGYAAELLGDFNGDGIVDGSDFLTWQQANGTTVSPGQNGDGNGDGTVNGADLDIWRRHFGETASASEVAAIVPEPSSILTFAFGTMVLMIVRLRKY